ncbi:MAG: hypothetical protein D6732_06295 [Methanobacteriota archaeon]|nr:MAG: hypothetical protein D6732_06295 [Euryarchaeota archaeon]
MRFRIPFLVFLLLFMKPTYALDFGVREGEVKVYKGSEIGGRYNTTYELKIEVLEIGPDWVRVEYNNADSTVLNFPEAPCNSTFPYEYIVPLNFIRENCLWEEAKKFRTAYREVFGEQIPDSDVPTPIVEAETTVGLDRVYQASVAYFGEDDLTMDVKDLANYQIRVLFTSWVVIKEEGVTGFLHRVTFMTSQLDEILSLDKHDAFILSEVLTNMTFGYLFDSNGWLLESYHFQQDSYSGRGWSNMSTIAEGHSPELLFEPKTTEDSLSFPTFMVPILAILVLLKRRRVH